MHDVWNSIRDVHSWEATTNGGLDTNGSDTLHKSTVPVLSRPGVYRPIRFVSGVYSRLPA